MLRMKFWWLKVATMLLTLRFGSKDIKWISFSCCSKPIYLKYESIKHIFFTLALGKGYIKRILLSCCCLYSIRLRHTSSDNFSLLMILGSKSSCWPVRQIGYHRQILSHEILIDLVHSRVQDLFLVIYQRGVVVFPEKVKLHAQNHKETFIFVALHLVPLTPHFHFHFHESESENEA